MLQLAFHSLTSPRAAIAQVLAIDVPNDVLYKVVVVLACLAGITGPLVAMIAVGGGAGAVGSPVSIAVFQGMVIMLTALAIHRVGARFGGTGSYNDSLKVTVWHGVVTFLPIVALNVIAATGNSLGPVIQLIALIWLFFVLVCFVQVLHGFRNLFLTGLGMVGVSTVFGIAMLLFLSVFGFIQPGGA